MENVEVVMSEKESMELITSMINKAKNRFSERGYLYLLWGWVILVCCIAQFVLLHFVDYEIASYVWFLTWIVVIYQTIYIRKSKKTQKAKTYTDEIIAIVWITFFICLMLVTFICIQFKKFEMIYPVMLVLYGIPTFLSGFIMKFKPLMMGGICCWVLALISPFIAFEYQLLLIALAVIAAWIFPGYLLQRRFKKEN